MDIETVKQIAESLSVTVSLVIAIIFLYRFWREEKKKSEELQNKIVDLTERTAKAMERNNEVIKDNTQVAQNNKEITRESVIALQQLTKSMDDFFRRDRN